MKVLVIEDENPTAQRLINMLAKYDPALEVLGCFPSVEKTLAYFSKPDFVCPDLLFLDIHLDDDLGFSVLEKLDLSIPVIFTTAYAEYSLQAFKNFSIDYLLKPVDYDELCMALDKFKMIASYQQSRTDWPKSKEQRHPDTGYKDRFMISVGPSLISIPATQIAYFSYESKSTFLNTADNKHFAIDYSLSALMEILDPKHFFRLNRSMIVSMSCIRSVLAYSPGKLKVEVEPASKEEIFVSLDRIVPFKNWLGK